MATPKLFVFSIFVASLFVKIAPYKSPLEPEDAISSLRIELEKLKTKVSILESTIEKSDNKLRSKEDGIKQMENIVLGKSQSIATLQNKIEALQQKGSLDAEEELNESNSHVAEVEQGDRLKEEIETHELRKKVSNEQKIGIHTTEEAPQVTEEEMMKAEPAATSMKSLKSLIVTCWNYSWRPDLDALFPKEWIPVTKDQLLPLISSLGSHLEPLTAKITEAYHKTENLMLSNTAKIQTTVAPFTQDLPVMKDQWLTFIYSLCSSLELLTAKTMGAYRVTKDSLLSYAAKIQTATAPFIWEAHKFAKPYINQFGTAAKPYAGMSKVISEPNSEKAVWVCRKLVTSIISYHNQVQQWLKTNELTRSLASMELAWFAATALLCLPVVWLCRFCSAVFRKRGRKLGRTSHPNNIHPKLKRPLNFDNRNTMR